MPVRKTFPTVGDLFAMLGIALGMQVVAGFLLTVAFVAAGWTIGELTPRQQGVFTALAYVSSMLPAYLLVLYYRRMRGGSGPVGRFSKCGLDPVLLSWGFLFMMAAGVVCEPLLSLLPVPPDPNYGRGIWAMLTLVVAAPVLEELLCRGVVLGALRERCGVVVAWLVSSLFFGVLHVHPMLVVNAFVIGLILGYIYIVTESLWAPMVLHALNNAAAYLMLMTGRGDLLLSETIGNRILYTIIYIGAVLVTLVSAWKVWRKLRSLKEETEKESRV
ncbi:MAG: CPBP family intramembrane metalloprotease [Alistipes sp.]|nr:CPBP family intramembrane metalloprotease [Alistipes sp.]